MNTMFTQILKEQNGLYEYLDKNTINISVKELIEELSNITNSNLQHLKIKVRTNIAIFGKDPESIDELFKILKADNTTPQIEILLISDYRQKHDNNLKFKYLLKIPFSYDDKLSDETKIIDNMEMHYTYDNFLETAYLTLTFDNQKIPYLIYNVNKNNIKSYNQSLYRPNNIINKVFYNKMMLNKNRKH